MENFLEISVFIICVFVIFETLNRYHSEAIQEMNKKKEKEE